MCATQIRAAGEKSHVGLIIHSFVSVASVSFDHLASLVVMQQ